MKVQKALKSPQRQARSKITKTTPARPQQTIRLRLWTMARMETVCSTLQSSGTRRAECARVRTLFVRRMSNFSLWTSKKNKSRLRRVTKFYRASKPIIWKFLLKSVHSLARGPGGTFLERWSMEISVKRLLKPWLSYRRKVIDRHLV